MNKVRELLNKLKQKALELLDKVKELLGMKVEKLVPRTYEEVYVTIGQQYANAMGILPPSGTLDLENVDPVKLQAALDFSVANPEVPKSLKKKPKSKKSSKSNKKASKKKSKKK